MKRLMMKGAFTGSMLLGALLVLAGCSLAPTYEVPSAPMPTAFKEAAHETTHGAAHEAAPAALPASEAGSWKTAQPSEAVSRGEWWTAFGDAKLDALEQQALDANQNLKAAAARVKEARALNQAARAGLFPTLDAGFGPTRQKVSAASQFQPDGTNISQQTFWRAQA